MSEAGSPRSRTFAVLVTGLIGLFASPVIAGQVKHPSGFRFTLPDYTHWEIEQRGDTIAINDETDKLPELMVFFFSPRKGASIDEVRGRLAEEINRPEVSSLGTTFAKLRLTGIPSNETIGDVKAWMSDGVANGDDDVRVAILERAEKLLIVLGVPKAGIAQRGAVNFNHIVHGVSSAPSDKRAQAREHNASGMKLYRKKDYKGAELEFRAALDVDNDLVIAHYNLACVLSLIHDAEGTSEELQWLKESKDQAAKEAFVRARVDPDLEWFRKRPIWKMYFEAPASQ